MAQKKRAKTGSKRTPRLNSTLPGRRRSTAQAADLEDHILYALMDAQDGVKRAVQISRSVNVSQDTATYYLTKLQRHGQVERIRGYGGLWKITEDGRYRIVLHKFRKEHREALLRDFARTSVKPESPAAEVVSPRHYAEGRPPPSKVSPGTIRDGALEREQNRRWTFEIRKGAANLPGEARGDMRHGVKQKVWQRPEWTLHLVKGKTAWTGTLIFNETYLNAVVRETEDDLDLWCQKEADRAKRLLEKQYFLRMGEWRPTRHHDYNYEPESVARLLSELFGGILGPKFWTDKTPPKPGDWTTGKWTFETKDRETGRLYRERAGALLEWLLRTPERERSMADRMDRLDGVIVALGEAQRKANTGQERALTIAEAQTQLLKGLQGRLDDLPQFIAKAVGEVIGDKVAEVVKRTIPQRPKPQPPLPPPEFDPATGRV